MSALLSKHVAEVRARVDKVVSSSRQASASSRSSRSRTPRDVNKSDRSQRQRLKSLIGPDIAYVDISSRDSRAERSGTEEEAADSISLEQWLWERAIFQDKRAGIYPWGFKDKEVESKFQDQVSLRACHANSATGSTLAPERVRGLILTRYMVEPAQPDFCEQQQAGAGVPLRHSHSEECGRSRFAGGAPPHVLRIRCQSPNTAGSQARSNSEPLSWK
eukprot:3827955-Rhodomonas_salina.1